MNIHWKDFWGICNERQRNHCSFPNSEMERERSQSIQIVSRFSVSSKTILDSSPFVERHPSLKQGYDSQGHSSQQYLDSPINERAKKGRERERPRETVGSQILTRPTHTTNAKQGNRKKHGQNKGKEKPSFISFSSLPCEKPATKGEKDKVGKKKTKKNPKKIEYSHRDNLYLFVTTFCLTHHEVVCVRWRERQQHVERKYHTHTTALQGLKRIR